MNDLITNIEKREMFAHYDYCQERNSMKFINA